LKKVVKCIEWIRLSTFPAAKSLAEEGFRNAMKMRAQHFSVDRSLTGMELRNLETSLHIAGLRDEAVLRKLELAAKLAEEFGLA